MCPQDGGGGAHSRGRGAPMLNADSLTTFSGLMVFFATLLLASRHFFPASVLMIADGAAGMGIFWDRWSERSGHQTQVAAIISPAPLSSHDLQLLATHLPLLLLGLVILACIWQSNRTKGNEAAHGS